MPHSHAASERPGSGSALQQARDLWRREGARAVWMGALARTVYRRLLILERELDGTPPPNPLGLEAGWLGPGRLDEYEALRGGREVARERLDAGDRCFAVRLDGELVSARWIASGSPAIEYLGMPLPLAADEVYVYDTFTAPGLRGRGIAPAGLALLFRVLADEGWSRAVCTVLPENRAAVRNIEKGGFVSTGRMGWIGLGPWRHAFVRRHSSRSTA